jgi:two-component system LytT family response regulator
MTLRVLLVDDDDLARSSVRAFLSAEPGVEVVGEVDNGRDALDVIARVDPDILFLDVDMPGLDGFGVLEALGGARIPVVVFVTGHAQHAIRAFEVHALDYLLKPFGLERFRQAFARAREAVEERDEERRGDRIHALLGELRQEQQGLEKLIAGAEPYLQRLMVKADERMLLLNAEEIDWVEAEGNYVRLHTARGAFPVRLKISVLEERLDPRNFARVHRSTIVNLGRVKELRPWFAGDYIVSMKDGTELKLSRGYRPQLEARLGAAG